MRATFELSIVEKRSIDEFIGTDCATLETENSSNIKIASARFQYFHA